MLTEEFKKKIEAKHSEEMTDMSAYEKLASEAMEHGHHHAAGILNDIAHEEKTHAELLEHILEYHE